MDKFVNTTLCAEDDDDDDLGKRNENPSPAPSEVDDEEERSLTSTNKKAEEVDEQFPLVNGPMPPRKTKAIYPFTKLKVGEGRVIGPDEKKVLQRLYSAVYSYNQKHAAQFRVVKRDGRVELWRTR